MYDRIIFYLLQMPVPKRRLRSKPATRSLFDINGHIFKFFKKFVSSCFRLCYL